METYNYTAIEYTSHNGGTCARGLGQRHALGVKRRIAVVVGKVEAGHGFDEGASSRDGRPGRTSKVIYSRWIPLRFSDAGLGAQGRGSDGREVKDANWSEWASNGDCVDEVAR